MFNKITETHIRSIAKLSIYKIISVIVTYFLAVAFGANPMQALTMGAVALFIGSLHYYLYERLSLLVPWGRIDGHDTTVRSIVKTIIYRITVVVVMMIAARMVFMDSNWQAFLMSAIKFLTHATTYFILERLFNKVEWGKVYSV